MVSRERKRARELNNQSHIPVWLVVGFFVLFLVCVLCVQGLVCMYKCIYSLSLPWGEKSRLQKSRVPLSKRAAARHALPRGASDSGASGACAGQLFSASRATAREIRPERRGAVPSAFGGLAPRRGSFPCHGALSSPHADVLDRGTPRAPAQHRW
jgi:hypothetical protein